VVPSFIGSEWSKEKNHGRKKRIKTEDVDENSRRDFWGVGWIPSGGAEERKDNDKCVELQKKK